MTTTISQKNPHHSLFQFLSYQVIAIVLTSLCTGNFTRVHGKQSFSLENGTMLQTLFCQGHPTRRQFKPLKHSIQGHPTAFFGKIVCSEDDLRSRIFGAFVVKFLPSPRIFEHLQNGIIAHFQRIFTLKRSRRIFGSLFSG